MDFAVLPSECAQNVLSFLELADCLRFASTCTTAMKEGLSAMHMRRDRMRKPYAVASIRRPKQTTVTTSHRKSCPSPTSTTMPLHHDATLDANAISIHQTKVGLLEELKRENPEMQDVIVLPTVQDRIKELWSLMAPLHGHPLHSVVRELCSSLEDNLSNEQIVGVGLSASVLIESMNQCVRPMKLQAHILKSVLFSDQDSGTSQLSHYIGDVLCVAYLLFDNDRNCSFAEGSPSPFSLGAKIRQSPPLRYRSWVLMHAGILRTVPLTSREKSRLGVVHLGNCLDSDITVRMATTKIAHIYNRMASAWTMPMDTCRTEKFMNSAMVLVYDDFGPLGPSFRGRDVVRVRDITAHSMLACFSSIRSDGRNRNDAMEWLCLAHEQAVKTRPLTVRSPIIRIG